MRSDLDQLMQNNHIDALWVSGNLFNNPDMVYLCGIHHVNQADLFKLQDQAPILFHVVDMEREEADKTGLKTQAYFSETPLTDYVKAANGDVARAMAQRVKEAMEHLGITSGTVAISGHVDIGPYHAMLDNLKKSCPDISFVSYFKDSPFLTARMTKSDDEIAHICKMGATTATVIGRVQQYLQSCSVTDEILHKQNGDRLTVRDVKSRINRWLAESGAENPEETIFAIGRDGGIPHSAGTPDDVIMLGKPIVFDIFPCEAGGGYFSDCTRTWCLGYAPDPVKELYAQVLNVHHQVIDQLKPNQPFREYQHMTCELFSQYGHITIADDRTTQKGYLHSIGHGVGLDIHEKPFSGFTAAADDILKPGVVFTIEPGLYYPDDGMGVRIEDTIYLNNTGEFEVIADYPYDLVIPMDG